MVIHLYTEKFSLFPAYPVDAEVSWACDEGFLAEGEVTAVCGEDGEWSVGPPRCSRVSCGPPDLPDHTNLHAPDFLYGALATYSCKEGHVMQVHIFHSSQSYSLTVSLHIDISWATSIPAVLPSSSPLSHLSTRPYHY